MLFPNVWSQFVFLSQQPYFSPLLNLVSVIFLFLTALVTFLSWRAANHANEIQMLPLLAVYFKGKVFHDRKVRIRNIGRSPAYNIKIESFVMMIHDIQKIWKLEFIIKGTNVIIPNEEKDLYTQVISEGKKINNEDLLLFHLDPEEEHDRKRIAFILTFQNAEGKWYFSKVETGKGGLFIKPAKRLNLSGYLYLFRRQTEERLILFIYSTIWKFKTKRLKNKTKI